MWNYSVDRAAFKFGQLNRGKISSHGCNTEKFDCPGQMQFNGLETARQVYFTQTFARQAAEAEQRYLLLHLDVWPAELPALARLWVAAERLSRALGREMVAWNLPCAFAWSDTQAVIESAELGIRAAVVRRKCSFGVANNASRREHLPLRFDLGEQEGKHAEPMSQKQLSHGVQRAQRDENSSHKEMHERTNGRGTPPPP